MPSVMDHPFFALAMSLRPKVNTDSGSEDTNNSPGPYDDIFRIAGPDESRTSQRNESPSPTPAAVTHTPVHMLDDENWLKCPKCPASNKLFRSDLALRMHLASEFHRRGSEKERDSSDDGVEQSNLTCPGCPPARIFVSELALRMHMASSGHQLENGGGKDFSRILEAIRGVIECPVQSGPTPQNGNERGNRGNNEHAKYTQQKTTTKSMGHLHPSSSDHTPAISESIKKIISAIADTKRVTFSDQMLQVIDTDLQESQILVLSSTRDMALYVHYLLAARVEPMGITCYPCVGGTVVWEDQKSLAAGPHIVTGTPGRVYDMIRRLALRTKHIKMFILNKEDELLQTSMQGQLSNIYTLLNPDTKIARASVRVVGTLADLIKRSDGV